MIDLSSVTEISTTSKFVTIMLPPNYPHNTITMPSILYIPFLHESTANTLYDTTQCTINHELLSNEVEDNPQILCYPYT